MRAVDIIMKKRDGGALDRDEIEFFVSGVTAGALPDYQASALLMAILLRGMTAEETAWLTDAMVRFGRSASICATFPASRSTSTAPAASATRRR